MDNGLGGTGFSLWGLLDAHLSRCYKNPQAEACATQARKLPAELCARLIC